MIEREALLSYFLAQHEKKGKTITEIEKRRYSTEDLRWARNNSLKDILPNEECFLINEEIDLEDFSGYNIYCDFIDCTILNYTENKEIVKGYIYNCELL